ncbi:pullulanase-type alpha-1,6-glucosidase [Vibrio metschnikovii]|uniref:pullulanase-type alpha-1,6-glucosidase n=1 Tax=Vibrio metschnikovii TaxID=28172 RepID=UPI00164C9D8D|nr:pullulanase-type alpha-1,6-glucosidase [Vibrio metschnikovii]MBC5830954.1 pullulanase-type alpha-1,6-glucosidase [Vibrio metschnikovii]
MNKPNFSTLSKAILPILAGGLLVGCNSSSDDNIAAETQTVTVFYKADPTLRSQTSDNDLYQGLTLHVWNDNHCRAYAGSNTEWNNSLVPNGIDANFGAYWHLPYRQDASQCINMIPHFGNDKLLGELDTKIDLTQLGENASVYTQQGVAAVYPELIARSHLKQDTLRIYLNSQDGDESDFTLHVWNAGECSSYDAGDTSWPGLRPSGFSPTYGAYWDLPINNNGDCINLIANTNGNGDYQTDNLKFEFAQQGVIGAIGMLFKGTNKVFYQPLARLPQGQVDVIGASAIFADAKTLLVGNKEATSVTLYHSAQGELSFDSANKSVTGFDSKFTSKLRAAHDWTSDKPHLKDDFVGFSFDYSEEQLKQLVKSQLWLVASDNQGVIQVTEVQPASALDALYADEAVKLQYGALTNGNTTAFRLWAPTAQSVKLIPYGADKKAQTPIKMEFDAKSGSWSVEETELKHGDFYRYQVTVYHPATDKVESYEVTDPYSLSLAMNSQYSQVVDLYHPDLKPAGWDDLKAPHPQANPAQFVLYEAHVRDFSALDDSTPKAHRGKYTAFAQPDTVPVKHLKALVDSGVTHLHLLPVFDIATINEDPTKVADIDQPFSKLCQLQPAVQNDRDFGSYCSGNMTISAVFHQLKGDDNKQNPVVQRLNGFVRDVDSFNWGYDPFHFTVPEGSYSTNPDGTTRIKEFRQMVMAVKRDIGMNMVMDVAYNHTNEAGVSDKSVLDKIVPWYYQRLNEFSGQVETSTCCSNTAPENRMFAKLIDDSIYTWTKAYKIDAFRWDLMGHHPLTQIVHTLEVAREVNPDVYFYGEGWNFGEVANDRQFKQASQANLAGTGIGSFSDRLRDAVRGGGPFDSQDSLRSNQGFGNGIYVLPNDLAASDNRATALHLADTVRVGMAGNLKDFKFTDSKDQLIKGSELDYNGQPTGYAQDAWEIQNYVSKHDNQTLWDNNQFKIAYGVTSDERVRMQAVSLSTAILGQGVPFIHMGSEILRSKSMQRDSYDSGDWYNRVDFTMESHNWNIGLPREDKDGENWSMIEAVITGAGTNAQPDKADMETMQGYFHELVQLRASSGLFTLGKGQTIIDRVQFHNTGSEQIAGVIVMSIDNSGERFDGAIDAERQGLVVVINASPKPLANFANFDATGYQQHSIQQDAGEKSIGAGANVNNGKLSVPAWSVAVFEKPAS